jgi:hypothetical protein
MTATPTLNRPQTVDTAIMTMPAARTYDLSAGRSAIEVVLAPLGHAVWRVRMRALAARLTDDSAGSVALSVHVSARARYASIPSTAGLFLPSAHRSDILAFTAALPPLVPGEAVPGEGTVTCAGRSWHVDLTVRCLDMDDTRVIASVRGSVARQDDLPLPNIRLGVDAALELVRCD